MAKEEQKVAKTEQQKQLAVLERTVADQVLARVNEFQENNAIRLPENYSPQNAIKTAWLILLETTDSQKKPVLESCTRASIANAMLKMVLLGLNPMKKQCDFIAYGNKLTMQMEYHGNIALAKRFGGVKEATGNVIYEGDEFKYEIDPLTGYRKIIKHEQNFENIDNNKIKGAYATLTFEEEGKAPFIEVMNMYQIRQSWNQGATKGNSPAHKNFPEEMSKKTVINRACKLFITSSDDGALYSDDEKEDDQTKQSSQRTVQQNANQQEISMPADDTEDAQVVEESQPEKKVVPESKKPTETDKKPVVTKTSESGTQTQMDMGTGTKEEPF